VAARFYLKVGRFYRVQVGATVQMAQSRGVSEMPSEVRHNRVLRTIQMYPSSSGEVMDEGRIAGVGLAGISKGASAIQFFR